MNNFAGSLDANVLLRLLLNDIPAQHSQVMKLLKSSNNQFAVADTAFIELVFVLSRQYSRTRGQICQDVRTMLGLKILNCNRIMLDTALDIYVKHPALSFEDCCLATHAQLNNALPLYTFDKKLSRQTEQTVLVPQL